MECLVKQELSLEAWKLEGELEFACAYLSREGHRNAFPSHSSALCRILLPFPQKVKMPKGFTELSHDPLGITVELKPTYWYTVQSGRRVTEKKGQIKSSFADDFSGLCWFVSAWLPPCVFHWLAEVCQLPCSCSYKVPLLFHFPLLVYRCSWQTGWVTLGAVVLFAAWGVCQFVISVCNSWLDCTSVNWYTHW